ncbi:MAG: hypothetical protein OPY03_04990 [Nitrosopumilus sp.]|nr:hypothetical protein [Nitrosopumilus sp.]
MDRTDLQLIVYFSILAVLISLFVNSAYAQEDSDLGVGEYLDNLFADSKESTALTLEECEIEGVGTNEECLDLSNAGFEALQASKDLAFSFHHFVETAIQFVSPIDIGVFLISAVSAIIGIIFFMKIGGRFGKHAGMIFIVFAGIVLLFLALGDTIDV